MAFINITQRKLSDLVLNEKDPSVALARREVRVTTAAAMPLGRLVFRAKGALDVDAPYAPLTTPATQLVATNEFAVIFGDKFSYQEVTAADPSGTTRAVAFVGTQTVNLKDWLLLSVNAITRDSAQHKALKQLLENQGIVIAKTLGA